MHLRLSFCVLSVFSLVGIFNQASANNTVPGLTYSVADRFTAAVDDHAGSHLHTTNVNPPTLPALPLANVAETGGFFGDEEVRALSEFDLTGQATAQSATLQFDVRDMSAELGVPIGGVFGQDAYRGILHIVGFAGNGQEDVSDFQAAAVDPNPLGTFDTTQLAAGDTVSQDVTALFNANLNQALGIRIQLPETDRAAGAITFENFRLDVVPIPEPQAATLWTLGMALLLTNIRRRRRPQA